jgi:hypothetical protein
MIATVEKLKNYCIPSNVKCGLPKAATAIPFVR